jgi:hypothetical protein
VIANYDCMIDICMDLWLKERVSFTKKYNSVFFKWQTSINFVEWMLENIVKVIWIFLFLIKKLKY